MDRSDLEELHYITPAANVPSILTLGILSHRRAASIQHSSVAMAEIQDLRRRVQVPGGRPLHDYANLYLHARNPMMYKRRADHASITVLKIAPDVLDLPGVVIASGNASSAYTRFAESPRGLDHLDRDLVFARSWWAEDEIDYFRRKSAICAELLVPERLPSELIRGAFASCEEAALAVRSLAPGLAVEVRPGLFFQGE
jgi:hypothetical protein